MGKAVHKIWTRDYDVYLCYGASRGLYNQKKLLNYATKEVFIFPNGKNREIYLTEDDYKQQWNALNNVYIENLKNFIAYVKTLLDAGELFVKKCKLLTNNVSKLTDKNLAKRYEQFQEAYVDYFVHLWLTFIVNELISERVTTTVNSLPLTQEEKHEVLVYATRPVKQASTMLLTQEAKKKSIKQLTKDFCWITTLNLDDNPATEEDIKNRISHNQETPKKPAIPQHLALLIEASRNNAYIKDRRDDYRRMGTCYTIPLYEEIGRRLNLTRKELAFLTPSEITSGLLKRDGELRHKAQRRQEHGFMMWWHNNELDFEDDINKINQIKRKLGIAPVVEKKVNEFKGNIGNKGKISGMVKIITVAKELSKLKKGEIMVAVTTNPDYLPGMERASAFITDEGGLTCHAAIVAREMKKPCIVGTKVATTVLKDGDLVEVDADKGIIRILKKEKY